MKKFTASALLTVILAVSSLAGVIDGVPEPPPPDCTENCLKAEPLESNGPVELATETLLTEFGLSLVTLVF